MKIIIVCAIAVILVVLLLARRRTSEARPEGPVSSWKIPDSWSIGKGTHDGKPIFTRFNLGLKPYVGRPEFRHQLGIAVKLNNPTSDGLPTSGEAQELNTIEDEIERRFLDGNESIFAGVITTAGMREFVLYTSNPKSAEAKAAELKKNMTHHEIQFVINEDPEWINFKKFAAGA